MVIKEESKKRAGIGHSLVSAPPLQHQTHRELVYRFFQFHERSPDFIGAHNETLSVAMRVHNPDRSPVGSKDS
jgi:hypothetical protein